MLSTTKTANRTRSALPSSVSLQSRTQRSESQGRWHYASGRVKAQDRTGRMQKTLLQHSTKRMSNPLRRRTLQRKLQHRHVPRLPIRSQTIPNKNGVTHRPGRDAACCRNFKNRWRQRACGAGLHSAGILVWQFAAFAHSRIRVRC